mmetsp:Transcript_2449/g.5806  ORF Transcript_2449/g.5806 Transcript_2449/m.5806 type:complete len:1868 (-) Transcript_2449:74-5677(-)
MAEKRMLMDDSWVKIQKKTFTKWVNMHLQKKGMKIEELESGFESGNNLINLIEILGQVSLGSYNKNPKMRIQKIENVGKALTYIKSTGVRLENMSAEDIVDKNLKLDLGLVWTIIQKFAIADISLEELTAKEALLLWCRRKTEKYDNVDIKNFTSSFQDGLAFNALIHAHKPHLIPYGSLSKENPAVNHETAFNCAEKDLGIPRLLDVEDMEMPDERSVMTYVSLYYHYFASSREQENAARRVGNLVALQRSIEQMQEDYETSAGNLSKWIKEKTVEMDGRDFGNSLDAVQRKTDEFVAYKGTEKPPKNAERLDLETQFTNIGLKLRANNRPAYCPPDGLSVKDINTQWDGLGAAEDKREAALRAELERQQRIAELLKQFCAKADNLDAWAGQKGAYLGKDENIDSVLAAQTALKVLDQHDEEYEGSKKRVAVLHGLGKEIIGLGAADSQEVQDRMDAIDKSWAKLAGDSGAKRGKLNEELAQQQRMEELRKDFAKKATDFNRWVKDTTEEVSGSTFGDSLEAVTNHKSVLDANDAHLTAESKARKDELDGVWNDLMKLGVKDNRYTALTIDDIENNRQSLMGALGKRREAYAAELARQQAMEAKRKEFADAAAKFVAFLEADRATVDGLRGEPAALSANINGHHKGGQAGEGWLAKLEGIDAEVKGMGITENPHTPYSVDVLRSKNRQHNTYIEKYLAELEEERKLKEDFDKRIDALIQWIRATVPKQGEREFDNTLPGAYAKVNAFISYKNTEKAEKFADKKEIESLNNTIAEGLKGSAHARPPFSPSVGVADLQREWDSLEAADKHREDALYAELRRQEKLRDLVSQFDYNEVDLNKWVAQKEKYLTTEEKVDTLSAAHVQRTVLEGFNAELDSAQGRLAALAGLGDAICGDNYKDGDSIKARVGDMRGKFDNLKSLAAKKDEANKREFERFEAKCKEFGDQAQQFVDFVAAARAAVDGLTGEPAELLSAIDAQYKGGADVNAKLVEMEELARQLSSMNITDNKHSKYTLDDLRVRARDLDTYVKGYQSELRDEEDVKRSYDERAQQLAGWVEGVLPYLKEQDYDNTLAGIQAAMLAFEDYTSSQKAKKASDKQYLAGLSAAISSRLAGSKHKRPAFAPARDTAAINALWGDLETAEKVKEAWLKEELARQQQLDTQVRQFDKDKADLLSFADKKDAYFASPEDVTTLTGAQVRMAVLMSNVEEVDSRGADVAALQALCKDIAGNNYKEASRVSDDAAAVKARFGALSTAAEEKRKALTAAKAEEQAKEKLRLDFAIKVRAYADWVRHSISLVNDHHFPAGLDELRTHEVDITANDQDLRSNSERQSSDLAAVDGDIKAKGITDNRHTSYTMADVEQFNGQLNTALGNRRKLYEAALGNAEAHEAKRLEFAAAAKAFVEFVDDKRGQIGAVQGEPQQCIDQVNAIYQEGADVKTQFEGVAGIDAAAKAMGVAGNRHTTLSLPVLANKVDQYNSYVGNALAAHQEDKVMKERAAALDKEWAAKEAFQNKLIEYATVAGGLGLWLEGANDEVSSPVKVNSTEESQAALDKFSKFMAGKGEQAGVLGRLSDMAASLNGEESPAIGDIRSRWDEACEQLDARKGLLEAEHQRQVTNEEVRVEYAGAAKDLDAYIASTKDFVANLSGELEDQLAALEARDQEVNKDGKAKLAAVERVHTKVVERNITDNRHTSLSTDQLRVGWARLQDTLQASKTLLQNEILKKKGSVISEAQLQEFRESFEFFDREKKGSLNTLEFGGVLQSLGVDASEDEVKRIFSEVDGDSDGHVNFEEFVGFMDKRSRDKDTLDEIVKSFKLMAGDKDFITESDMRGLMSDEEVAYLLKNMPDYPTQSGDKGYDYKAWAAKTYGK